MKTQLIVSAILLSLSLFSAAVIAQQPAVIDRELFFGNPEYAGAQISPDGKYISFIKPYKETMNIWVKEANAPFESARPMTVGLNAILPLPKGEGRGGHCIRTWVTLCLRAGGNNSGVGSDPPYGRPSGTGEWSKWWLPRSCACRLRTGLSSLWERNRQGEKPEIAKF